MYKKVSIVPVRFVFADGSVGLIDRPDLFDSELRKSTPMLWEKMYGYKFRSSVPVRHVQAAVKPNPRPTLTYERRRQIALDRYVNALMAQAQERKERDQRLRALYADDSSPWTMIDG
jgi:hypothetical protein